MATLKKLNYPQTLDLVVGSSVGIPTNNLLPSKSPLYNVFKAKKSTYQDVSLGVANINDYLIIYVYKNVDSFFTFNGIKYQSSTIINGKNKYLKSSNSTDVFNSLFNMFRLNGLLDSYDYSTISTGPSVVGIVLTAKQEGRNNYIDVSNLNNFNDYYFNNDSYLSPPSTPYYLNTNIDIYKSIGNNISQDVDNYEIGLDIYKYQTKPDFKETYITSLSKKGFGLVDYDMSNIFDNSIESWKPTINNFNINNNKYLDLFTIQPWQKWVDKQEDPNNTYADIYYDNSNLLFYEVIDAREPLFQNINYDLNTLNQNIQPNYLEIHSGTYGIFDKNNPSTWIYDKNLTNQPRNKQMNRSFELLSNVNRNSLLEIGQTLNDRAVFKFTYNDNFTETVVLTSNNTFQGDNTSYINQLSFKIDTLSAYTTSGLSMTNLKYLDVHFETDTYNSNVPVVFETQRYFIDSTVQQCDDVFTNDIDYLPLVFKNGKGGFDLFEFETPKEINTNRAIQTIDTPYTWQTKKNSEFTKIWDLKFEKQYSSKTRVLTDQEFVWLQDFILTTEVYVLDTLSNDLYPIIVLSTDYNYKQNEDNIINIIFKYSRPETV